MRKTKLAYVDLTTEVGKKRAVKNFLYQQKNQAYLWALLLIIIWALVFWLIINLADNLILFIIIALVISQGLASNIFSYLEELNYIQRVLNMKIKIEQIRHFIEYGKSKKLIYLEMEINETEENLSHLEIPPYVYDLEISTPENEPTNVRGFYKKE